MTLFLIREKKQEYSKSVSFSCPLREAALSISLQKVVKNYKKKIEKNLNFDFYEMENSILNDMMKVRNLIFSQHGRLHYHEGGNQRNPDV